MFHDDMEKKLSTNGTHKLAHMTDILQCGNVCVYTKRIAPHSVAGGRTSTTLGLASYHMGREQCYEVLTTTGNPFVLVFSVIFNCDFIFV